MFSCSVIKFRLHRELGFWQAKRDLSVIWKVLLSPWVMVNNEGILLLSCSEASYGITSRVMSSSCDYDYPAYI